MFASLILSVSHISAQTQEVTFTNHLPVFVGDLVNESNATLEAQNAGRLCARLNHALNRTKMSSSELKEHSENCIFEIVRFSDLSDAGKVQNPDVKNWYVVSSNQGFWSLEDLQQNKRLFGEGHVSFFYILLNRTYGFANIKNVQLSSNTLTVTADNNFSTGSIVTFSGIKTATYLNGQQVTIQSGTLTTFTATFTHANYASAADTGTATVGFGPTQPPTPGPPSNDIKIADCSAYTPPAVPPLGADSYYVSYTIDVKRKVSANIQHLFALLGAEGLKNADQIAPDWPSIALRSDQEELLGQSTKYAPGKSQTCWKPDAVFGGGVVDVAYRPSDISITNSLKTGAGGHEVVVAIDKTPYVIDNEGRYFVDFSVPITVKNLSAIQYQATGNTFSPVNTNSLNAFLAVDGYFPANDVKSQNWTRYPHPLAGVAFAKQPLSKILLAGAWGPSFSELYIGVAWVKQPRVAQGSNSCSASTGSPSTAPNSFGRHYCAQFSIGLNLSVTSIANKLGAPK